MAGQGRHAALTAQGAIDSGVFAGRVGGGVRFGGGGGSQLTLGFGSVGRELQILERVPYEFHD